MKVIHFLNIYNPLGISKYPCGWGRRDFYSPRQCIIGRLLTGEMVAFCLECGKRVDVKTEAMARKNQQDIGCFEADTFGQGLIDDLEIKSSRESKLSPFPPQKIGRHANSKALFEDELVWVL